MIFDILEQIQEEQLGLMEDGVVVQNDFGMRRSFCCGSNTHALNQGVTEKDIELKNQRRQFEEACGRRPKLRMLQHYTEVCCILPLLLPYSLAL